MKDLTLVALYGPKKDPLNSLIRNIWDMLDNSALKGIFQKYEIEQVHLTITGLEKLAGTDKNFNANIWKKEGVQREMCFEGFYEKVAESFPIEVQIGGFDQGKYTFMSFGRDLYSRTFAIETRRESVNLIGWAVNDDLSENKSLLNLRNSLYAENHIRHSYHDDKDNDFYMVLGKLKESGPEDQDSLVEKAARLEEHIRNYLLKNPVKITISTEDLYLVRYEKTTLERSTSIAWKLEVLKESPGFIDELFTYPNRDCLIIKNSS